MSSPLSQMQEMDTITHRSHTIHSEGSGEDSEWGFVGKLKEKGH
jgi:hypothetical protein